MVDITGASIGPTGIGLSFGGGGSSDPPYSFTQNQSSSVGGSSAKSGSQSSSIQYPDQIWGAQIPYFQNLYGQANNLMQSGGNQGAATDLWNQGAQGFDTMMNPGVNPYLQAYAGDVQQNFENNILPSIGSSAQGFGQFGGSRQGVAEGVAAGYANRDITNMASKLYGEDMNRMLGAMGLVPEYGTFGMSIPWYGANQMAGIMGSPTVLGQGGISSGDASSKQSAFDFANSSGTSASGPDAPWVETITPGGPFTFGPSEPTGGGGTTAPAGEYDWRPGAGMSFSGR